MMTTTSDITAKFDAAIATLAPIVGPSKDDDLRNVRKVLLQICLSIQLSGSKSGKVTGLILGNIVYLKTPGSPHCLSRIKTHSTNTTRTWKKPLNRESSGSSPLSEPPGLRTSAKLPPQSTAAVKSFFTPLTRSTTSPSAARTRSTKSSHPSPISRTLQTAMTASKLLTSSPSLPNSRITGQPTPAFLNTS